MKHNVTRIKRIATEFPRIILKIDQRKSVSGSVHPASHFLLAMESEEIEEKQPRSMAEIVSIVEALVFVSNEPVTVKTLADVLEEDKETVEAA